MTESDSVFSTDTAHRFTLVQRSIGDLVLTDGGGSLTFTPQPDMTVQEVAYLLVMIVQLQVGGGMWRPYAEKHNLLRHFK